MEQPQDQSTPAPAEPHILASEPGLDLPMEVQIILQRYDRRLPFELRVACAKLEYANRHENAGRRRSLLAQAGSEHRAERQYAESNGGWRHEVNRMAQKAAR